MPQLGESVTEGTINTWLVKEGDYVNKYDPIADIMTDKVNAEVPSSYSGIINEIVTKEGDTIAVGETMCFINAEEAPKSDEHIVKNEDSHVILETREETSIDNQSMKNRYSPAVLRMAQENGIDLTQVDGSGRGGRITRKDIESLVTSGDLPVSNKKQSKPEQVKESPVSQITEVGDIEIPIDGVRKVIAQNMVRSKQEIPHAWMTVEADVTELVRYRDDVKSEFKRVEGFNLTYFSFFVKAVAQALKEFPQLNSTWAGDKIIQRKDINLSIAVAKEDELFVPVIKQADEKSIKRIAKDIHELAAKARSGRLTANEMQGGTFTINNSGSFGAIYSMGVINYPQAAILQVESIVKRPVIIEDMFAARHMVHLSLSLDHRILDGLICGRFLARVKAILENMNKETANVF